MIRLTTREEWSRTVVVIEGQLLRDCIEVVETCCAEAEAKGKRVDLLLSDVSTLDRDGQMLLRRLAARGVHIEAKGIYTSYLVEALTADAGEHNGSSTNHRAMVNGPKHRKS